MKLTTTHTTLLTALIDKTVDRHMMESLCEFKRKWDELNEDKGMLQDYYTALSHIASYTDEQLSLGEKALLTDSLLEVVTSLYVLDLITEKELALLPEKIALEIWLMIGRITSDTVYQLKLRIQENSIVKIRRIVVNNLTFHDLQITINYFMRWNLRQSYKFIIGDTEISFPVNPEDDSPDPFGTLLSDYIVSGQHIIYIYDEEDRMECEIILEKVSKEDLNISYPICVDEDVHSLVDEHWEEAYEEFLKELNIEFIYYQTPYGIIILN